MEIELKFIDSTGTSIYEKPLVYDGMIPLPILKSDVVLVGTHRILCKQLPYHQ